MYKVYYFDPNTGMVESLVYSASCEQDALDQFWDENKLAHRSVDKL